jgi:hypothetical protein
MNIMNIYVPITTNLILKNAQNAKVVSISLMNAQKATNVVDHLVQIAQKAKI